MQAAGSSGMSEISGVTLRAMGEELFALNHEEHLLAKEAFVGKAITSLGSKLVSGAGKGLSSLVSRGGRVGSAAGRAQSALSKGVGKGMKRFGGKAGLHKAVGTAAVGAGTLGVAGGATAIGVGASRGRT